MGVITISLNDEVEEKLRRLALLRFSNAKKRLSMTITEALEKLAERKEDEDLYKSIELLEKGINMGGIISKKRGDLHAR